MSIENPTLAHFRHFSSLFTNLSSTTVESPLQIHPFYAKQSQFPKSQMNVSNIITKDYVNETLGKSGKNKANSNPIQTQTNPIYKKPKINVNKVLTRGYDNISHFTAIEKQTQFKPKQTQFQRQKMLPCLTINNRRKSLGYYADEIEAPNAYDDKAVELFGEFAFLNLPEMTENTCIFKMDLIAYDHQTA